MEETLVIGETLIDVMVKEEKGIDEIAEKEKIEGEGLAAEVSVPGGVETCK